MLGCNIAISGIQNPERKDIRNAALDGKTVQSPQGLIEIGKKWERLTSYLLKLAYSVDEFNETDFVEEIFSLDPNIIDQNLYSEQDYIVSLRTWQTLKTRYKTYSDFKKKRYQIPQFDFLILYLDEFMKRYPSDQFIKVLTWNLPGSKKFTSNNFTEFKKHHPIVNLFDIVFMQELSSESVAKDMLFPDLKGIYCGVNGNTTTNDIALTLSKKVELKSIRKVNNNQRHFSVLRDQLALFNVHLSNNSDEAFKEELELLKNDIKEALTEKRSIIVAGDFNCNRNELGLFYDLGLTIDYCNKPTTTANNNNEIDFIAYSNDFELVECRVLKRKALYVSNHYPKMAILRKKK